MVVLGIWLLELGYAVVYRGLCAWGGATVSGVMGPCSAASSQAAPGNNPGRAAPATPAVATPTGGVPGAPNQAGPAANAVPAWGFQP